MSSKILAGNWKMHKTRREVKGFFEALSPQLKNSPVRKIIAPSPTLLETALQAAHGKGIDVFAQDMSWASSGAFTGETSVEQLLELGVAGTLIGHSERRQYFAETDESATRKAVLALEKGLQVIYCLGERLEERQKGLTLQILERQLRPVIDLVVPELKKGDLKRLMIAYEPIWAIGTGLTAELPQIREAHEFMASFLEQETQLKLPLLYGGSVKTSNVSEIVALPCVSGTLVGGASLEATSYTELHNATLQVLKN